MNGPIRLLLAFLVVVGFAWSLLLIVWPWLIDQGFHPILTFAIAATLWGWKVALAVYLVSSAPEFRHRKRL